jgi:trk system potassium uptake protein TrkA
MRVIVIGAGEVGSSIAADLCDTHDVVVVERDPERVESLTYELDVLAMQGDGTSLAVLEEAGLADADMVIASTDSDEANIVACATAKTVDDPFTIARVKKVEYLRTWERATDTFNVDFMVSTDLLTAQTIVRIAGMPGANDVDTFADGAVRMAQFAVTEASPIAGQTVVEADRFDSLTFAALIRDGDVVIPGGETTIEVGDEVVVIGSPESTREFATAVSTNGGHRADDVVVFGGGAVGYQTAGLFESDDVESRLVESDAERARELAEELPDTLVMESDPTDRGFLEREHVGDADLVVAALDSDERNLLVSLLAQRLGADRAVAVVETTAYAPLFETVGIDAAVNPRDVVAEEITRFTRGRHMENVALIENDRAEVVEIEVDADSVLHERSIVDATDKLPDGVVIGAITRGGDFVVPRGDTVFESGDHVVIFVDEAIIDEVVDLV